MSTRRTLLLIVALTGWSGVMMFRPASSLAGTQVTFARATEAENASEAAPQQTPGSLPHGKFLLDYLLVAALLAGAMYAVCRSSRRV